MRPAPLAAVAIACALSGCGADRAELAPSTVDQDAPRTRSGFPRAGMQLELPAAAVLERRKAPGVFRAAVGESFIGAFAYRRAEQLPRDERELQAARRRLVRQVLRRDRDFELIRSRTTRAAGARAVELVGDQRIGGGTLRTRSLHVYRGRGEYVLDMLAPVRDFPLMNRTFFSPAVGSLKVTGRVEARGRS